MLPDRQGSTIELLPVAAHRPSRERAFAGRDHIINLVSRNNDFSGASDILAGNWMFTHNHHGRCGLHSLKIHLTDALKVRLKQQKRPYLAE